MKNKLKWLQIKSVVNHLENAVNDVNGGWVIGTVGGNNPTVRNPVGYGDLTRDTRCNVDINTILASNLGNICSDGESMNLACLTTSINCINFEDDNTVTFTYQASEACLISKVLNCFP